MQNAPTSGRVEAITTAEKDEQVALTDANDKVALTFERIPKKSTRRAFVQFRLSRRIFGCKIRSQIDHTATLHVEKLIQIAS